MRFFRKIILLFLFPHFLNCGVFFLDDAGIHLVPKKKNKVVEQIRALVALGQYSSASLAFTNVDNQSPYVFNASPASNSTQIQPNQVIVVTFSEPISQSAGNFILLSDSGGNLVSGALSWGKDSLSFQPGMSLIYGMTYMVTVKSGIKDLSGNSMTSDYSFSFTILATPDSTAPAILSTTPVNAFTGYNIDNAIYITFTENIDTSTVNAANVSLTQNGASVSFTLSSYQDKAILTPSSSLLSGTLYTVVLSQSIKDLAGNTMTGDYILNFTTALDLNGPRIVSRFPKLNSIGHSINAPISVTFDKSIIAASVNSSSFYMNDGSTNITGTVSVVGQTATFTPSARLTANTTYTVTITNAVLDTVANPLPANYIFTFLTKYTKVIGGATHTCVIVPSGNARCWGGQNTWGHLGTGDFSDVPLATNAQNLNLPEYVTDLSTRLSTTCVVLVSGAARCWGDGSYGSLGNGNSLSSPDPYSVISLTAESPFVQISADYSHTCAKMANGAFKCWGNSSFGQLGYGNLSTVNHVLSANSILPVSGTLRISTGWGNTCILLINGNVRCWGANTNYEAGDTTQAVYNDSTAVNDLNNLTMPVTEPATGISTGVQHTCIILTSGKAKCWGLAFLYRLGNGSQAPNIDFASAPEINFLPRKITQIATGMDFTCVLLDDGNMKCWGSGIIGGTSALGYGSVAQVTDAGNAADINIGGTGIQISTGLFHTCVVMNTDEIKCWGNNIFYQLGDGTTTGRLSPPTSGTGVTLY